MEKSEKKLLAHFTRLAEPERQTLLAFAEFLDARSGADQTVGVPASIYFMWATYRLSRDSTQDWNRRPLVGHAAPRGRRSPWADNTA